MAALLLSITAIDERLLERDLFGRQLVWWVWEWRCGREQLLSVDPALVSLGPPSLDTAALTPHSSLLPVCAGGWPWWA